MKHIIVQIESIMSYPPTISLVECLRRRGDEVIVVTASGNQGVMNLCKKCQIHVIVTKKRYNRKDSVIKKFGSMLIIRENIRREMECHYTENSLIWIMTSISLKHVGNWILNKKYIMYMYELSKEIRYCPQIPFIKVNLRRMMDNASAIIECEYNRAHILKAWFDLKELPYIVPNKILTNERIECCCPVTNMYAKEKIKAFVDKKIILYQGIIDRERPIKPLINAIQLLDDSYVLVIMSADINKIKEYEGKQICLIPFVNPPQHLEVTSWAHIGVLLYSPVIGHRTTSPLNSIYCAPNKLYEYSMFGIPMLGNDIPGLKYSIEYNHMGECFKTMNPAEIVESIKKIEENYDKYQINSKRFYEKTDTETNINRVVDDLIKIRHMGEK